MSVESLLCILKARYSMYLLCTHYYTKEKDSLYNFEINNFAFAALYSLNQAHAVSSCLVLTLCFSSILLMLSASAASALSFPCMSCSSASQSLICRMDLSRLARSPAVVAAEEEDTLRVLPGVPGASDRGLGAGELGWSLRAGLMLAGGGGKEEVMDGPGAWES